MPRNSVRARRGEGEGDGGGEAEGKGKGDEEEQRGFEEAAALATAGGAAVNALFWGPQRVRQGMSLLTMGMGGVSVMTLQVRFVPSRFTLSLRFAVVFGHLSTRARGSLASGVCGFSIDQQATKGKNRKQTQVSKRNDSTTKHNTALRRPQSNRNLHLQESDDAKLALAKSLGATYTINYYRTTPDWATEVQRLTAGQGVDHVGGAGTIEQSLRSVRQGGLVSIVGILTEA